MFQIVFLQFKQSGARITIMQITDLPIEITEKILFYLNMNDLSSWFSVFENCDDIVSNLFWKKVCERDGFRSNISEEYNYSTNDKYWNCVNLKLCRYNFNQHLVENPPVHIYNSTIVSSFGTYRPIKVWNIIGSELVFAHNLPPGKIIAFNRTLAIQNSKSVDVYQFDNEVKVYTFYTHFQCSYLDLVKIGNTLIVIYLLNLKEFIIFHISESNQVVIPCPDDVDFLLSMNLEENRLYIVISSLSGCYKIKVFNAESKSWILDIIFFGGVCSSSNEPNIWVNPYYIVSTNISFRGSNRVIYDQLKVWKTDGTLIKVLDIDASQKCYFHCCFSNDTILVTTSQSRIAVIKETDIYEMKLLDDQYINICSAPGNIIIATYKSYFQTYDWKFGEPLHLVELGFNFVDQVLFNSRFYIAFNSLTCCVSILNFTGNHVKTFNNAQVEKDV